MLASNALERSKQAPDVPTVAETVPNFDFAVVVGVLAAKGTPQVAIDRISKEISEAVRQPDLVKSFHDAVVEPVGVGPADYGRVIDRENEAMAKAGKAAHLNAD